MANIGRILRIDEKLLTEKSPSEIEVMVKLMMVKHYNNASGNYKKHELTSYVFYDLSGNSTKFFFRGIRIAGSYK